MMNTFVYNGKSENLQKALDMHSQGGQVLCHQCGTQLLVLPDWESAIKYEKRPGIYCIVSEKHICQWFFLSDRRRELWRRFNEWKENEPS
jgi:hypothetical protein